MTLGALLESAAAGLPSRAGVIVLVALSGATLALSLLPRRALGPGALGSVALGAAVAFALPGGFAFAFAFALLAVSLRAARDGMMGALLATAAALLAGALSPTLGLAALATCYWQAGDDAPQQGILAVAAVALAATPGAGVELALRLGFLLGAVALAVIFRRPSREAVLGRAGQRAFAAGAGALPAAAVGLLPFLEGRLFALPRTALLLALGVALTAAAIGALAGLALLGISMLFSTANAARPYCAGSAAAATLGLALLGTQALVLLAVPALLGLAVACASPKLLPRSPWRARKA